MTAFHVITGMPRSGSSLLCNILRQNPRFFVSATSELAGAVAVLSRYFTESWETKAAMIRDPAHTATRIQNQLRQVMRAHYQGRLTDAQRVIFDKSRTWSTMQAVLRQLVPDAKLIVTVVDIRRAFASVEKQHERTAFFDAANHPLKRTMDGRALEFMADNGLVGLPARGIEDLLRRKPPGVHFLKMESFVRRPKARLEELYEFLGEEPYPHDLENVENTNEEVDALYNMKYPHDGSGPIRGELSDWTRWVSPDIAKEILRRFPLYNAEFGYT